MSGLLTAQHGFGRSCVAALQAVRMCLLERVYICMKSAMYGTDNMIQPLYSLSVLLSCLLALPSVPNNRLSLQI